MKNIFTHSKPPSHFTALLGTYLLLAHSVGRHHLKPFELNCWHIARVVITSNHLNLIVGAHSEGRHHL